MVSDHIPHRYIIDNIPYITVESFAIRVNRKQETIRKLIRNGNSMRKLKAIKHRYYYLIPESELYDFPFVEPGRVGLEIHYHQYRKDGGLDLLVLPVDQS